MNHVSPPSFPILPPPASIDNFVDLCRWRAAATGEQWAFTHLGVTNDQQTRVTYQQLDQRIRGIAAVLAEHGRPGERVLIVQPPGIDYVSSLFACMYAGMIAVPVYPPDGFRLRQTLPRLQAITREADAKIMLSQRSILGESIGPLWQVCEDAALATDEIDDSMAAHYRPRTTQGSEVALLQYTSGSTGTPRGVTLRHHHLMANMRQGYRAFDVPGAVVVVWLPPYHDMGLIGGILLPLYGGRPSVLMDPLSFVQQPIRWLQAISTFRGTSTASPNFGYELCLRKIRPEACEGLDLASWQVATVGAEPIRAATMRRFQERFAPFGFRATTLTPAYGMAEATLAVTAKPRGTPPVAQPFSSAALQAGSPRAIPWDAAPHEASDRPIELVNCGRPVESCTLRIVDPRRRIVLPEGQVGEIWVRSPAVADGYWRQPERSAETFNVPLAGQEADPEARFLRTGDLGFLQQGELFVSGRRKELIIVAGRNFFPHDIEAAIAEAHPAFRRDGGIAFSIDEETEEQLVIVQEVLRPKRYDTETLVETIRQTLYQQFGLSPQAIVLAIAGSLPKTSSGKLQRLQCRQQFLEGSLQARHTWEAQTEEAQTEEQHETVSSDAAERTEAIPSSSDAVTHDGTASPAAGVEESSPSPAEIELAPLWCELLELAVARRDQHFLDCGGHSLTATQLLSRIGEQFGVTLSHSDLAEAPRFGQLAQRLEARRATETSTASVSASGACEPSPAEDALRSGSEAASVLPLTAAQQRFWFLDQLERRDAFLHVDVELHLTGVRDPAAWVETLAALPRFHEALRLRFDVDAGGNPVQTVQTDGSEPVTLPVEQIDLAGQSDAAQDASWRAMRTRLIQQPFALDRPPLARAAWVRTGEDSYRLLLVSHHLICDGSSLLLLWEDLKRRLGTPRADPETATQPATQAWPDVVRRDRQSNASEAASLRLQYWIDRLADAPTAAPLQVPPPRSVDEADAAMVASVTVERTLDASLQQQLEETARQQRVTPFVIWLTAWQEVLPRYCGRDEMIIGVPVSNRRHSSLEHLVGCFLDLLPYRTAGRSAEPHSFAEALQKTQVRWLRDLDHLTVPLEPLLESLSVERIAGQLPLMQHLLLQQPSPSLSGEVGEATCRDYRSSYSTLAGYETALVIEQHGPETRILLVFNPQRLDPALAENLLAAVEATVRQGVTTLTKPRRQLACLGRAEAKRLQQLAGSAKSEAPPETAWAMIQRSLDRYRARTAVVDATGEVSFGDLQTGVHRLAAALTERGIQRGDIVAFHLDRSHRLIEAILAIWKVGAAYLPLDPNLPAARLEAILADAVPRLILCDDDNVRATWSGRGCSVASLATLRDRAAAAAPATPDTATPATLRIDDLAYVIYTSGSTGLPKGVMIEQGSVANLLQAFSTAPGLREGESLLAATTESFDISVLELFLPLVVGGTASMPPSRVAEDPDAVVAWLAAHPVDVIQATPSALQMLMAGGWQPSASQRIWCGGEPLSPRLVQSLTATGTTLWNVYGPTETTVWSLIAPIDPCSVAPISLGRPIDATQIEVVDACGLPVPEGVAGELWIAGAGVARGYLGRSELTAERFVEREPWGRQYRTGDLVRRHPDGVLEFLGRGDRQIKIRGHRVELGEIEAVLEQHPDVTGAAVTTAGNDSSQSRLVGFYTTDREAPLVEASLSQFLAERLPGNMLPARLVALPAFPTSTAGKLDYAQLPLPDSWLAPGASAADPVSAPPRTATEASLARLWKELLQIDDVGIHERFFELGGHSLLAAQMVARLREATGIGLTLREAYQHATIAELASWLDAQRPGAGGADAEASPSLRRFAQQLRQACPAEAVDSLEGNLSPAEQRLWFVDRLEPNHPFYNLPLAVEIDGPLVLDRLAASLNDCVARHEILRSTYHARDGEPFRRVTESLQIVPTVVDLTTAADAAATLDDLLRQESRRPFDLTQGPLLRALFVRLSETRHVILLVMHHIISDGWSMGVMMHEINAFYRARQTGDPVALPALEVSFAEYASWQRQRFEQETTGPQLAYWQTKLADATETLDLPTDFPRPAVQDFEGATHPFQLSASLSNAIDRWAAARNLTPFAVFMAAYSLLLSRYARQQDLTIGTAVANRPDPAMESLIGFFVNTLVLRLRIDPQLCFENWVEEVQANALEAFSHQAIPFEELVRHLADDRDRSHSPLFQAALILQNAPRQFSENAELHVQPRHVDNATAKYDLSLLLMLHDDRYVGHFEYRSRLFAAASIEALTDSLISLLDNGIRQPHLPLQRIPLLSPVRRAELVEQSIGPQQDVTPNRLDQWITTALTAHAEQSAIGHQGRQLRYRELAARVDQLATGLRARGIGVGDRVVIYMARSIDQVAMVLAVIRIGAVFVPIDTETPRARTLQIAQNVEARRIVTHDGASWPASTENTAPLWDTPGRLAVAAETSATPTVAEAADLTPDSPAYIIFTSGSTGVPKGCVISHAAICNFVRGWLSIIPLSPSDRCSYIFSPSFDGSLAEVFPTLISGAHLEVFDREQVVDPQQFAAVMADRQLTFAALTPAMLGALQPHDLPGVRRVLSAGAALVPELVRRWLPTHELFNGYGPTECTVGVAMHQITSPAYEHPPVGRPLPNMRLYVLDAERLLVPEGVPGEVYIGGASVGLGYWKDAAGTAQRFVRDPFASDPDARMYRTGDLGRWNHEGLLEIIGRADDQIKLRGYRIEPNEIASRLERMPEIQQAAVVLTTPGKETSHESADAEPRLIAYFVPETPADSSPSSDSAAATTRAEEPASLAAEHVEQWVTLFDESHQASGVGLPPEDNFSGWISVITGQPIPLLEMRAWADETAERILALRPRRVLEIGCGTGLIFLRIAEQIEQYVGVDVMPSALADFRKTLEDRPPLQAKAELLERRADDLADLPAGHFDCIVMNSVVQYFPSQDYLVHVLQQAERLLAPGGQLFAGDLRNRRLHASFATAAEMTRLQDEPLTVDQCLRRIRSRIEHDEELLVDPALLDHLQPHLPRLCDVTTHLKTAPFANELNRFRFDAVLSFDRPRRAEPGDVSEPSPAELPSRLAGPNGHVVRVWTLWQELQRAAPDVAVQDLIKQVDAHLPPAETPAVWRARARQAGVTVSVDWDLVHPEGLRLRGTADALARLRSAWPDAFAAADRWAAERESSERVEDQPLGSAEPRWTNQPLARRRALRFVGQIRERLRGELPPYMIPAAFVELDRMPLTLQGKLDKAALPPPPAARPAWAGHWQPPRDAEERLLADVWEELLEITPIGVTDDFFELGGHSMLAVRMVSEVEQRTSISLPLAALFQRPTIEHLAEILKNPARATAGPSLVPLNAQRDGTPLFCIHPAGGTVFCYQQLASHLGNERPLFGVQAQGVDGRAKPHQTLVEMATAYAEAIRQAWPAGPYHLLGWSLGGNIAYEVARQLDESGCELGEIILLDAARIAETETIDEENFLPLIAALFPHDEHFSLEELRGQPPQEQLSYFLRQASQAGIVPIDEDWMGMQIFEVFQANVKAVHAHRYLPLARELTLIRPQQQAATNPLFNEATLGWKELVSQVHLGQVQGDHAHMLGTPAVEEIALIVRQTLGKPR